MKHFLAALALWIGLWVAPANATWALVQHPNNTACGLGVSSCAVTVTSTGTNHLIIVVALFTNTVTAISSVSSTGGSTSTWVHCAACLIQTNSVGIDVFYTVASGSGETSITANFSGVTNVDGVEVLEYSSSTTFSFDTGNSGAVALGANPAGVALTLGGANDVIAQFIITAGTASGISGTYTDPADFPNGDGAAGSINTASGTAPTWMETSGLGAKSAIAFQETSSGAACPVSRSLTGAGC